MVIAQTAVSINKIEINKIFLIFVLIGITNCVNSQTCFSIGDSKQKVESIQGTPDEITTYSASRKEIWDYGYCKVEFQNEIVESFRNSDYKLKVCQIQPDLNGCFSVGDSKQQVESIQGTPNEITSYSASRKEIWDYDYCKVEFQNEIVASFRNSDNKLRVCQGSNSNQNNYPTITTETVQTKKESIIVDPNVFTVEFSATDLTYNDHVGNEWLCYVIINGNELYRTEKIEVNLYKGQKIKISCYLHETEETYNDSGSESHDLYYSDLLKYRNDGFYIPVTIRESNGRYAGNTAQMKFYFNIK